MLNYRNIAIALGSVLAVGGVASFLLAKAFTPYHPVTYTYDHHKSTIPQQTVQNAIALNEFLAPSLRIEIKQVPSMKNVILQHYLVYNQFLVQKAIQAHVTVPTSMVNDYTTKLLNSVQKTQYGDSQTKMNNAMQQLGVTNQMITTYTRNILLLQQYAIQMNSKDNSKTLHAFYQSHRQDFTEVVYRAIVVTNPSLAKKIDQDVTKTPKNWNPLSSLYNTDKNSQTFQKVRVRQMPTSLWSSLETSSLNTFHEISSQHRYIIYEIKQRLLAPFSPNQKTIKKLFHQNQVNAMMIKQVFNLEKNIHVNSVS